VGDGYGANEHLAVAAYGPVLRGKVKDGEYPNMSEVVRDAVRRLHGDEAIKSARMRIPTKAITIPI